MIRGVRVGMLAVAVVFLVGGFTVSGFILAVGSIILHRWDRRD